jgi:sodium-coupled monocarboxylate transporter 8/12
MWYSPIAVGTVLIVGLIVSYLTHPLKPNEVDPRLLIPIDNICCCFLPQRIREWFRCGVDYKKYLAERVSNEFIE